MRTRIRSSKRSTTIQLAEVSSHLPSVTSVFLSYHEALNMLGVKMPAQEVFVPIDYSHDLGDNLNVLMDKLLEKYPQLTD